MKTTQKHELFIKVRDKFELPEKENTWFTKSEMQQIVQTLKGSEGEWSDNNTFFEEELYELGWTPQETTDSHPTKENLLFFISQITPSKTIHNDTDIFTAIGFDSHQLSSIDIDRKSNQVTFTFAR